MLYGYNKNYTFQIILLHDNCMQSVPHTIYTDLPVTGVERLRIYLSG